MMDDQEMKLPSDSSDNETDPPRVAKKRSRVGDVENPNFTHPTTSIRKRKDKKTIPVEIKNKFNYLNPNEVEVNAATVEIRKNQRKPPPIVVNGVFKKHNKTVADITKVINGKFYIKYSAMNSTVYTETVEDRKKLEKYFDENDVKYHTYTPREEKTHAFTLRGLDSDPDLEEIKTELQELGIPVVEIHKLKATKSPAYMVVTGNTITLRKIQKEVRVINYTAVRWNKYYTKREVIQCHNCQMWGHATANCHRTPNCLKCAENHATRECPKSMNTPAKCANCFGSHPANSTECAIYVNICNRRARNAKTAAPAAPKVYREAPIPAVNVWEERRKAQEAKQKPVSGMANPQTTPKTPTSPPTNKTHDTNNTNNFQNAFYELKSEFNRLNQYVDIRQLLTDVKRLNQQLQNASPAERKYVILEFFLNLND